MITEKDSLTVDETPDPLIDANAVATLLGIPRDAVLRLQRKGRIPSVKFSRKLIRFHRSVILRLREESSQ